MLAIRTHRVTPATKVREDMLGCAKLFFCTVVSVSAFGIFVVFFSRWLARAAGLIDYFAYVLLNTTAVTASLIAAAAYLLFMQFGSPKHTA
ncbi:MAG: hypothetical protein V3V97_09195 [Hyphomicrobiaceae bacterium]